VSTRDIVYIALFAAIVAALGVFPPIVLPLIGVPITAQSLGVMLAGSVLGAKRGGLAIVLFLALVAVGMPILAGGRGGFGVLLGPSGGFLFGWPIAAFVIGWMIERSWSRLDVWRGFGINVLGGIVVMYLCGIPWIAVVAETSLWQAFIGVMGFLPGDVIKAAVAAFVAVTVKRSYPIIGEAETGRA
jgi:biotin transport system substrate-specific component